MGWTVGFDRNHPCINNTPYPKIPGHHSLHPILLYSVTIHPVLLYPVPIHHILLNPDTTHPILLHPATTHPVTLHTPLPTISFHLIFFSYHHSQAHLHFKRLFRPQHPHSSALIQFTPLDSSHKVFFLSWKRLRRVCSKNKVYIQLH